MYINYGDSRRPIECGSGMEKMVSSLALRVALTNISSLSKADMLIIDEGFGSLDSANVEAVTQLLQKLRNWPMKIELDITLTWTFLKFLLNIYFQMIMPILGEDLLANLQGNILQVKYLQEKQFT